jgi:C4-dicarboxylate-specific signal transduction histidine kinase
MDQKELEKHVRILERKLERSERNRAELEDQRARGQVLYRRLHQDLQNMQSQLIQSEKLASLGHLTAGIAHEIKNPLNFIVNFADVTVELVEEVKEAVAAGQPIEEILEDLRRNAEHILHHGKRADAIVRAMMRHASGGSGEKEALELNPFVREFIDLAYHGKRARIADFNVTLEQDLDPLAGSVSVFPQDLGRVFMNLLDNAFDAVRERSGEDGYGARVRIATHRSADEVVISVSDNGPGIPSDVLDRLFEPFFTTKAAGSGTGLGLSLSYDIGTKGHGGSLTAQNLPDGGAVFVVRLPV